MTQDTSLLTYFCIFWFVGLTINAHTKFEGSNFVRSKDIKGIQNLKNRSGDVAHALLTYFCISWFEGLEINPYIKFEFSKFVRSRDIKGIPIL